jgi:hypothetical protein
MVPSIRGYLLVGEPSFKLFLKMLKDLLGGTVAQRQASGCTCNMRCGNPPTGGHLTTRTMSMMMTTVQPAHYWDAYLVL